MPGVDFSEINPAFFFSRNKKKSIYKVFTSKNLLDFGQLKKAKGSVLAEKLEIRIISNERFRIG